MAAARPWLNEYDVRTEPMAARTWLNELDVRTEPVAARTWPNELDVRTEPVAARTWLNELDVKDLFDMSVVGGDLENGLGVVSDACDVDGDDVIRDARPRDVAVVFLHLEDLRPQPEAVSANGTLCFSRVLLVAALCMYMKT